MSEKILNVEDNNHVSMMEKGNLEVTNNTPFQKSCEN